MKKTLTINLSGMVFHIDEDAYESLSHYLDQLRAVLASEEGIEEIMSDIESRLRDLFSDRMRYGMHVIRLQDVEDVIQVMGRPQEIAGGFEADSEPIAEDPQSPPSEDTSEPKSNGFSVFGESAGAKKRLMRDPDQTIIAGVCGGLAQYTGFDAWVYRVIFLLMFLMGYGVPLLLYIVLALALPRACTIAQKLEMRGVEPTVENIRNAKQEGVLFPTTESGSGLGKGCLVSFLILLAILFGFPLLGVILMTLVQFLTFGDMTPLNNFHLQYHGNPLSGFYDSINMGVWSLSFFLVIALPLAGMIMAYLQEKGKVKPLNKRFLIGGAITWVVAAVLFSIQLWDYFV